MITFYLSFYFLLHVFKGVVNASIQEREIGNREVVYTRWENVYGAEYETASFKENIYFNALHDHDVPCAVCLVQNRSVSKMFPGEITLDKYPARKSCYEGWSLDYEGYLTAGDFRHPAGKTYTCVDKNSETIHGGHANNDGYLFYFVEAICGSLKCPPYVQGRELTCAVCSKM